MALKVLVPPPAVAHLVRERTRREILAVRALAHPNVVPIFDLLEEGPFTVLVMERVLGSDLQALVAERGPLPPEQVAALGQGVAEALAAAHRRGIVHRDVKPRNILVDGAGRPRLTDFGAARVDGQETLTETGGLIGTLDYAAPEVMGGSRGDARADIHALGLTLYFALTGRCRPARRRTCRPTPPRTATTRARPARRARPGWTRWSRGPPPPIPAAASPPPPGWPRRWPPTSWPACPSRTRPGSSISAWPAGRRIRSGARCVGRAPRAPPPAADLAGSWSPPRLATERDALAARLAALLHLPAGDPGPRGGRRRQRTLGRLPSALAERAARQLQARGVPVRLVSARADLALLPRPFLLLGGATAAVGTWAGLAAHPALVITTPLVTALMLALASRAVGRPLLSPPPADESLPPALVGEVSKALGSLPDGDGRVLLADLVRLGRSPAAPATPPPARCATPPRRLLRTRLPRRHRAGPHRAGPHRPGRSARPPPARPRVLGGGPVPPRRRPHRPAPAPARRRGHAGHRPRRSRRPHGRRHRGPGPPQPRAAGGARPARPVPRRSGGPPRLLTLQRPPRI